MDTVGIQLEKQVATAVAANANVIFDTIISSYGPVSYNLITGEITINKNGRYFVNWWVASQAHWGPVELLLQSPPRKVHRAYRHHRHHRGHRPYRLYRRNRGHWLYRIYRNRSNWLYRSLPPFKYRGYSRLYSIRLRNN